MHLQAFVPISWTWNRMQCHTAAQKLKWCLCTLVREWKDHLLRHWDLVIHVFWTHLSVQQGKTLRVKPKTFNSTCSFVSFRGQRSGDQDDDQWPQPTHASCFLNASCSFRLAFWGNQVEFPHSSEIRSHRTARVCQVHLLRRPTKILQVTQLGENPASVKMLHAAPQRGEAQGKIDTSAETWRRSIDWFPTSHWWRWRHERSHHSEHVLTICERY